MQRSMKFCAAPGCTELVRVGAYCEVHRKEQQRAENQRRGGSRARGYTTAWSKYSKAFLARPENQFCSLHLDAGCAVIAQCVDHIIPPSSPGDPLFWDAGNHQPACIHCNSVKGHRAMRGTYKGPG